MSNIWGVLISGSLVSTIKYNVEVMYGVFRDVTKSLTSMVIHIY